MILEDKLTIMATQERVWQVTTDVEGWPEWSPAMQRIRREDDGDFRLGSSAWVKQKAMPETRWTVTEMNPGREFSWQARLPGLEMLATHRIDPVEKGVTSLLRIEMNGWTVSLFGPVLKILVGKSLREENQGLKRFSETQR